MSSIAQKAVRGKQETVHTMECQGTMDKFRDNGRNLKAMQNIDYRAPKIHAQYKRLVQSKIDSEMNGLRGTRTPPISPGGCLVGPPKLSVLEVVYELLDSAAIPHTISCSAKRFGRYSGIVSKRPHLEGHDKSEKSGCYYTHIYNHRLERFHIHLPSTTQPQYCHAPSTTDW